MSTGSAPPATSFDLDVIRSLELAPRPQFVCWRPVWRGKRWDKPPIQAGTGAAASHTDPSTWCDLDTAATYARAHNLGIGFVFASDSYTGVDLDGCVDLQSGSIAAWARAILLRLGSYSEISPSGGGIKTIIVGTLRDRDGRRRDPVEIYSRRRFFTLTGHCVDGTPPDIQPRQQELDDLVATLWPPAPVVTAQRRNPMPTLDDDALIDRATRARNGETFRALWRGDWEALGYSSQSETDLALLSHLAFWTNGNADQMERLFAASGLARAKWFSRDDYRSRSVTRALAGVGHA